MIVSIRLNATLYKKSRRLAQQAHGNLPSWTDEKDDSSWVLQRTQFNGQMDQGVGSLQSRARDRLLAAQKGLGYQWEFSISTPAQLRVLRRATLSS